MPRIVIDPFLVKLLLAVAAASLIPAYGWGANAFAWATNIAIALLFFLHGARLSRDAIISGLGHWRLHISILGITFMVFPLLGLAAKPLISSYITHDLYLGFLFLCCLPATVQSAIAFTSIARGNVSAAVCSASASTFLGVFITPLLVGVVMLDAGSAGPPITLDTLGKIASQLLLPFIAGHAARPWIGSWVMRRRSLLKHVDQSTILLVVYTAFSAAVIGGIWATVSTSVLAALTLICCALLAIVLILSLLLGHFLNFNTEDRITLLFCASKKSLATGIPIANIIFASHVVGSAVLPLMIFHQIQLIVCAIIAGNYARRPKLALP